MSESFTLTELRNAGKDEHFSLADLKAKPYDVPAGVRSLMNVGQAVSFGFGDEIAGLLGADKARYRETVDQFRKDYPGSALLGTVAGSMLLPFGAAKVAANPWATAATVGTISGAMQGAGDAERLADVPNEASKGALVGMAAGPILLGATKPVGSVAGAIANQLGTRLPGLSTPVTQSLARSRIATAFERDQTSADAVAARMVRMGPEARMVDAAGENTRNLLDVNATLPGKTKNTLEQAIEERIAGRSERLDPIADSLSGKHGRAGEMFATWEAQKQAESAPLYEKAFTRNGKERVLATSDDLKALLSRPVMKQAIAQAQRNAENRVTGANPVANFPDVERGQPLSLRQWDEIKKGLDDVISAKKRGLEAVSGDTNSAASTLRDALDTKRAMLKVLDIRTGNDYRKARESYSGYAALQDALEDGRKALAMNAEQIGLDLARLSDSERQAYRIGAAESLREKFGGPSGQAEFLNAWKNRATREKLQALVGNEAKFGDVMALLNNERTFKRLEGMGKGSQTAAREAGAEDQTLGVAGDMLSMAGAVKTGAWPTLMGGINRYSARLGTPEPVRDSIGDTLLQRQAADELRAILTSQRGMKERAALWGGLLGAAAGQTPGLLSNRPRQ